MSIDKIAIVAWDISDFYVSKLIPKNMDIIFVLENRRWNLHTLDISDSINLLQRHIDSLIQQGIKSIIIPPVFEIYFRYLHDNKSDYIHIILPIFETFFKEQILPYSVVWKVCLIWNPDHTKSIEAIIQSRCQLHILTTNQSNNRYFQKNWILYHHDTTVFDTLHDMGHSRFVNKLIKIVLKKIKDRSPDTIVPTNYGYLKWTKTIHGFTHKKIRFYNKQYIIDIISKLIWVWSDCIEWKQFSHKLYYAGKSPSLKMHIDLNVKKEDLSLIKLDIN